MVAPGHQAIAVALAGVAVRHPRHRMDCDASITVHGLTLCPRRDLPGNDDVHGSDPLGYI